MFRKPAGQRNWRIALLIAMIVAFLGPWAFDLINVPAQYECSAPNIRLGDSNLSGTLPPKIGNLSRLRILQIDGNPLFGPLPETLTNLNNQQFWFDRTNLCEPADAAFQAWLDTINDMQSSRNVCPRQDN